MTNVPTNYAVYSEKQVSDLKKMIQKIENWVLNKTIKKKKEALSTSY